VFAIDESFLTGASFMQLCSLTAIQRGVVTAELRYLGLVVCVLGAEIEGMRRFDRASVVALIEATVQRFATRSPFTPQERARLSSEQGDLPEWKIYDAESSSTVFLPARYEFYRGLLVENGDNMGLVSTKIVEKLSEWTSVKRGGAAIGLTAVAVIRMMMPRAREAIEQLRL
jgi:hypothetical protein